MSFLHNNELINTIKEMTMQIDNYRRN
jgi:hypothetical protein